MKRSSSNCLRVSMRGISGPRGPRRGAPKTKHERTLYVLLVFRNPLIWREQIEGPLKGGLKPKDGASAAGFCRRCEWLANQQTICLCEGRHHRGVLQREGSGDPSAIAVGGE